MFTRAEIRQGKLEEQRDALRLNWINKPCWVDGKEAVIRDSPNDNFAHITLSNGLHGEWSWWAVDHVMSNKQGKFTL